MPSIAVVQGASRGIGLQFCRTLLQRTEVNVIATCRCPDQALDLNCLYKEHKERLNVMKMDVTQEDAIKETAEMVEQQFKKVDLLINCAAMLHPSGRGETSLRDVSFEGVQATLATNTIGPLLMAKYFSPMLSKGSGSFGLHSSNKKETHSGILVNMSARVGSISDNGLGGWYSYRMSKSALNMATRNLSIELRRRSKGKVICIALHPGTVNTDLSRPYHRNVPKEKLFSTLHSVECMMAVISKLTLMDSGKYFAFDGTKIPF
ncbi:C-signal-like [Apostichopus japonicus]|uniref:C-signal-like n=1 Tax=Stichopus japonicus TaxID=307972 RepID=UPI003AB5EBAF